MRCIAKNRYSPSTHLMSNIFLILLFLLLYLSHSLTDAPKLSFLKISQEDLNVIHVENFVC